MVFAADILEVIVHQCTPDAIFSWSLVIWARATILAERKEQQIVYISI